MSLRESQLASGLTSNSVTLSVSFVSPHTEHKDTLKDGATVLLTIRLQLT